MSTKKKSSKPAATKRKNSTKGKKIFNAKPVEKRNLLLAAGAVTFQEYLKANAEMFNLTELERMMKLPNGTLRHIRTGARVATPKLYENLRTEILPKMCELVFVLQNYSGQMIQREIGW